MPLSVEGSLYRLFIDPLLRQLRRDIRDLMEPGSAVLEVASGSGAQAIELARYGCRVLGIDMSSSMVGFASGQVSADLEGALEFRVGDARTLNLPDRSMDTATITLALHAMPEQIRLPVLQEMARVAPRLVIADYAMPLPRSFAGRFATMLEYMAGGTHLAGFRNYRSSGGLEALLGRIDSLRIISNRSSLSGVVSILEVDTGDDKS